MQADRAENQNPVHGTDSRRYSPDKPRECKHCYFGKGKRKGCSQEECYYILPEKDSGLGAIHRPDETGNCQGCPYGSHSPCIGYCIRKILLEMREKKQAAGKEGNGIAG